MRRRCLGVLVALSLVACNNGEGGTTSPTTGTASTSTTGAVEKVGGGWVHRGISAASNLLAAGDVVVVVDISLAFLSVVALDARSGEERWRSASTPSRMLSGMGVGGPAFVGGTVVHLEPGIGLDFVVGGTR